MKKFITIILIILVMIMLIITLAPGLLSFWAPRALAHVESEPAGEARVAATILEPDIFIAKAKIPVFFEIKEVASGDKITGLNPTVEIEDTAGKVISVFTAEPKGENYFFEYQFPGSGEYKIHTEFVYQDENLSFDFDVFVSEAVGGRVGLITVVTGAVLVILILGAGILKKKVKAAVIWSIIVLVIAGLTYSLYATIKANPSLGIVTCPQEGSCFWTAHIHAFVPISICGEEYRLPIEVGRLDGPHTHEEKNTIHWHDKLPYDQTTQSITNTEPLTLGAFFSAIEVALSDRRIADKNNGDLCPDGKAGTVKVFVNGSPVSEFREFIWKDQDVIVIFFDSRSVEEIQAELKVNPIEFPKLGRG